MDKNQNTDPRVMWLLWLCRVGRGVQERCRLNSWLLCLHRALCQIYFEIHSGLCYDVMMYKIHSGLCYDVMMYNTPVSLIFLQGFDLSIPFNRSAAYKHRMSTRIWNLFSP
jgi:hypothetical protein